MKRLLILCFVFCSSVLAYGAGNAENGAKLYKTCISCHKKDGRGDFVQKAPKIAGQHSWYIVKQLKDIQSTRRDNKNTKKMLPFIKNMNAQDFEDLAAYISQLKCHTPE